MYGSGPSTARKAISGLWCSCLVSPSGVFRRSWLLGDEIEAERRLFYVAVTRAIDELYLAHPDEPAFRKSLESISWKPEERRDSSVSRFLWEMNLPLAKQAGRVIESGGPFESCTVHRPEVANEYFSHFPFAQQWAYTPHIKGSVVRPADEREAMQAGSRVRHEVFGFATVDRWIDRRVMRLIFDDGETRMIVASSQIKLVKE